MSKERAASEFPRCLEARRREVALRQRPTRPGRDDGLRKGAAGRKGGKTTRAQALTGVCRGGGIPARADSASAGKGGGAQRATLQGSSRGGSARADSASAGKSGGRAAQPPFARWDPRERIPPLRANEGEGKPWSRR